MDTKVEKMINQAVMNMINKCGSTNKIKHLLKKHDIKIHFIPKKYRVFGGLLQSMNIQFGNFIEELMAVLIANEENFEVISTYKEKRGNTFHISNSNEKKIDEYITKCQVENDFNINAEFPKLLDSIIQDNDTHLNAFSHDIDLLFRNKETGVVYYLEMKYNDDHDTGKFVDINRKFIKTYAYLTREFNVTTQQQLVPILFFFTNKRMKGNIYIPETTNIRRGKKFFDEFLSIQYSDVDEYMSNLSESDDVRQMFNDLYANIMKL